MEVESIFLYRPLPYLEYGDDASLPFLRKGGVESEKYCGGDISLSI